MLDGVRLNSVRYTYLLLVQHILLDYAIAKSFRNKLSLRHNDIGGDLVLGFGVNKRSSIWGWGWDTSKKTFRDKPKRILSETNDVRNRRKEYTI